MLVCMLTGKDNYSFAPIWTANSFCVGIRYLKANFRIK